MKNLSLNSTQTSISVLKKDIGIGIELFEHNCQTNLINISPIIDSNASKFVFLRI